MEKLYYYLEDVDGGFIVDQNYMDNDYDENTEEIIMVGTKEELFAHIGLYNDNND